jgi:hypothetical protein
MFKFFLDRKLEGWKVLSGTVLCITSKNPGHGMPYVDALEIPNHNDNMGSVLCRLRGHVCRSRPLQSNIDAGTVLHYIENLALLSYIVDSEDGALQLA